MQQATVALCEGSRGRAAQGGVLCEGGGHLYVFQMPRTGLTFSL